MNRQLGNHLISFLLGLLLAQELLIRNLNLQLLGAVGDKLLGLDHEHFVLIDFLPKVSLHVRVGGHFGRVADGGVLEYVLDEVSGFQVEGASVCLVTKGTQVFDFACQVLFAKVACDQLFYARISWNC